MFAIKLGLRNLTRQKRRNMITAMVIAYAFFAYLLMDSLMNGMEEMSFENIRDLETGNIQIVHSDYWEEREELPLENLVYLDQDVEESLKNIDGLSGISPELRFVANLNNGIDELPVLGLGIDPDRYQEVFTTGEYLVDGSMFSLGENKGVLGEKTAQLMDLKINDYITLLVRTKEDTFNTIDVVIAGIVNTTHPMVNSGTVFVPLDIAQQALNVENSVSLIAIKVNPGYEESVTETLNQNFKRKDLNLNAYSWRESAETVIALSTAKKSGIGVILFVVLLIGIIGIINNVILSALERTEEIGMMKALGMKEMEIVSVFMVEATGIGIIGGLMGCLLGAIGVGLLTKYGFDLSYAGDMTNYGIPILNKIYGVWNFSAFYFLFILGIIVALFSSIIPALWAARKDPVKAIYHR
ncbi:Macrolide export ATP-binding/permease protein MacB [subsurface metagenome]|jgi:putative ABC transport system permease protein